MRKIRKQMNAGALFWALVGATFLPSFLFAQTAANVSSNAQLSTQIDIPPKDAYIAKFAVGANGALHIAYSHGANVEIPRERGRFSDGENTLTQEMFSDIQLADDRRHIGWLAEYKICAQSYPCPAELVIYESRQDLKHITPPQGIVWRWRFLAGGKQVVLQYGFPHGDDVGVFALYDTATGRRLSKFSSTKKKFPKWVHQLDPTVKAF